MPSVLRTVALAAALGGAVATAAFAQEKGGVQINGVVNNATVANRSVNVAKGVVTRTVTSIGSINSGVRVNGNLNMAVQANDVVTAAGGLGNEATTSIGSVHEGAVLTGTRSVVVSTGRVVNSDGCVIIGSLGKVPGC